MNAKEALSFVEERGIVLVSAKGPGPRLTEAIINEPIEGSWWAHPKSKVIFNVLQVVTNSKDVLVCRLVNGKITLVHRRLWPALVKLTNANRLSVRQVAQIQEEHTPSGRHITRDVPFPAWVPHEVVEQAKRLKMQEALAAFAACNIPLR